jgi:hypothetical protein
MNSRTLLVGAAAILVAAAVNVATAGQLSNTFSHWLDHPAINYTGSRPTDVVAELNRKLQAGPSTSVLMFVGVLAVSTGGVGGAN